MQQCRPYAHDGDAADTQHDKFGIARELPQRIHGAYQHGNRDHFVDVARRAQQHEDQYLADAIGALADVFELLDQVEEREHGQQAECDQQYAGDDLLGQVAFQ